MEKTLGELVVVTFRGQVGGRGGAKLVTLGKSLLDEYEHLESHLGEILSGERYKEVVKLKISARNRLKGKVVSVEKNGLMAKIRLEIATPASVTALISKEAVEDLGIKVGDQVEAGVKATEVMIAK